MTLCVKYVITNALNQKKGSKMRAEVGFLREMNVSEEKHLK